MPNVYLIQINVDDLDRAMAWYSSALGFRVSRQNYHYPVAVDLEHENTRLTLHKASFLENNYPPNGRTQICIQVDNIQTALEKLKSTGVSVLHKTPLDFPKGKYAAIRDPFGNTHELVEITND